MIKRNSSNVSNVKKVFSYYTSSVDELVKNIEWVDADLLDVYSLMQGMEGISEIYHCAAMVSFEPKHEEEMMKINIEGTANMVNAAVEKGIKKFLHVSSIATIGRNKNDELCTEDLFWKASPDNSNYALSKYAAEREVWRASEEGLNMIIVNPSVIIGGGNWQQSSSNMFSKAYKGIKFYTDGLNGFIDVRDVVNAYYILFQKGKKGNIYNICSGKGISLNEVIKIMANKLEISITHHIDRSLLRPNDNKAIVGSNEKIKNDTSWIPYYSIEQSLKDVLDFYN